MSGFIKTTVLLIVLILSGAAVLQAQDKKPYYFGIGTSISSFTGGEFGKRFGIRYAVDDDNAYYHNNNNYYNKEDYYDNDNNTMALNPMNFMLIGGVNMTKFAALELQAGFMWHSNGDIQNPDLQTGFSNGLNYVDRNANASLLAIPLIASLKIFPLGNQFYVSGGYGIQYTHESVERIRDYYIPGYYGNSSYRQYLIGDQSQGQWMTGYKASVGFSHSLFGMLGNEIELSYSNFTNNSSLSGDRSNNLLTLNRTPSIGNVSLGTKIFFGF
jgi:hypothetical protein